MFMLSCILFFRFTWVQTSKLNEFTAGLTWNCCGYTADLSLYKLFLLITWLSLLSHLKNNSFKGMTYMQEKYVDENRLIIMQQHNMLFPLPTTAHTWAWRKKNKVLYSTFYFTEINHRSNNYYLYRFCARSYRNSIIYCIVSYCIDEATEL